MKEDHIDNLGTKLISTAIYFVDVGFDQFASSILETVNSMHIQNIFPFPLKIRSRSNILILISLQKRKANVKNEDISIFFRLVIKLQYPDNSG